MDQEHLLHFDQIEEQQILKTRINYDDVMDRIGFGKFQVIVIAAGWSILIPEGIELFNVTMLMNILEIEWGINSLQKGLIGCVIFVGFLGGSSISGVLASYVGRKALTTWVVFSMVIIAFLTCFSMNFIYFLISRLAFGFAVGFLVPIFASLALEVTPTSTRGVIVLFSLSILSVGALLASGVYMLILDGLYTGSWRYMYVIQGVFSIFGIIIITFSKDSPRMSLVKKQFDEAFELIEAIGKLNQGPSYCLTEEEKEGLIESVHSSEADWRSSKDGFIKVFKKFFTIRTMFTRTVFLLTLWFCNGAIYYGLVFALPSMSSYALGQSESETAYVDRATLLGVIPSYLLELVACILLGLVIEVKIFGRKRTVILFMFMTCVFSVLGLTNIGNPLIWVSLVKFSIGLGWNILYPYSGELYPTNLRAMAVGMMNGLGRFGAAIVPTLLTFFKLNPIIVPMSIFAVLSLIATISAILLPYDTCQEKLDEIPEKMNK